MSRPVVFVSPGNPAVFAHLGVSILLLAYSTVQVFSSPGASPGWYVHVVVASTIWIISYIAAAVGAFRHAYLFSTGYIAALLLFHLGLYYQGAIGILQLPAEWERGAFGGYLRTAGWYVCLALGAFGVGFSLALSRTKPTKAIVPPSIVNYTRKAGHWAAIGLLLASGVFLILAVRSYGNLLDYARADLFSASADSRGLGAFKVVFPSAVVLYFFSAQGRTQRLIGAVLAALAFGLFMLTGYRSAALFPALVAVALWVKSGRKLPLAVFASGCVVVLVLIAASGYLRSMGRFGDISVDKVSEALAVASVDQGITAIGGTIQVVAHTVEMIPSTAPFRFGKTYIQSLVDAIPNITTRVDYSGSRADAVQRMATDPSAVEDMRPADWLTYKIAPWHFSQGFGVGFSAIAEAYMNFGMLGVVVIFLGVGYLFGRLDAADIFGSPWLFIGSATLVWIVVRTVRNDSSNLFKPMVLVLVPIALWWIFSRVILGKRRECPLPWHPRPIPRSA